MNTTQINGITLTEEAIKLIRNIQEGENGWITNSLEEAIDFVLEIDFQQRSEKERLNLIFALRLIEKYIKTIAVVNQKKGGQQ